MRGRIKITLEQLRIAAKVRCVCGGESLSTLGCGFVVVTRPCCVGTVVVSRRGLLCCFVRGDVAEAKETRGLRSHEEDG